MRVYRTGIPALSVRLLLCHCLALVLAVVELHQAAILNLQKLPRNRERHRKFEEWKSTQQKAKRNRGESYVSKTEKQVSEFITQYGSTVYIGMALVWPAL